MSEATDKALKLKGDRSMCKQQVTYAAKRLKAALDENSNPASTETLCKELQTCMNNFISAHDQYCCLVESYDELNAFSIVNGQNLEEYHDSVNSTYLEALNAYARWKQSHLNCNKLEPMKLRIGLESKRLLKLCDRAEDMLRRPGEHFKTIQSLICEFEPLVNSVQSLFSTMCELLAEDELHKSSKEIEDVIDRADCVKRQCVCITVDDSPVKSEVHSDFVSVSSCDRVPSQTKRSQSVTSPMSMPHIYSAISTTGVTDVSWNAGVSSASMMNGTAFSQPNVAPNLYSGVATFPSSTLSENPNGLNSVVGMHIGGVTTSASSVHTPYSMSHSNYQLPPLLDRMGNSDIYLKKTALPEFSGLRKDWPEFKAVWRRLAEGAIRDCTLLAHELKRSLKGQAKEKVANVYITRPEAYEIMWQRLSEFYDDATASVQAALDGLSKLKPVHENDYKGIVNLTDTVESTYVQLLELGQTEILSMREVDKICELLPPSVKMLWIRTYHQLPLHVKLKPLETFMGFLATERAAVARLAESSKKASHSSASNFAARNDSKQQASQSKKSACVVHRDETCKHKTTECKEFEKLSIDEKYQALRNVHACFKCFGFHRRDKCMSKRVCEHCKKSNHHSQLCRQISKTKDSADVQPTSSNVEKSVSSNVASVSSLSLYAIQQALVVESGRWATVFCDSGSSTSFITHDAANRLRAKKVEKYTLDVTTMGNVNKEYETWLYEVTLRTVSGKLVPVAAFGMPQITGQVSKLNLDKLADLFPGRDVTLLQRRSHNVDILLGCDHFGLHPKREISSAGDNLSIMQGDLGVCVQGCHADLEECTSFHSNFVRTLHGSFVSTECHFLYMNESHSEFICPSKQMLKLDGSCCVSYKVDDSVLPFISGEDLATEVIPKCGGCKCGKCPVMGHTYSFHEEQELEMIRSNLKYNVELQCWHTSYPWLIDPSELPDSYSTAFATLRSTESVLSKDPVWAKQYCDQIQDMLDRGVARKLTPDEIESWTGPKFYISHLAVRNPKSQSTPVRIVFNSSQNCKGVSLNSALAKGPDSYLNSLLGLLLRWREQRVAVVGDIKKMFHSVHLDLLEQHCHRFLWRDLKSETKPDTYIMLRVNMGDRPAPAICTEAMYKTADKFEMDCPRAAFMLRKSSYVDDLLDSFPDVNTALDIASRADAMLQQGGFKVKCWQLSGEDYVRSGGSLDAPDGDSKETSAVALLKGDGQCTRVLGVGWIPVEDILVYDVALNFSVKRKGQRTEPNLTAADVPCALPLLLTRRMVLEQVMMVFDPLGLLCPFTLLSKLYLRETWSLKLGWDDALPASLRLKWQQFFTVMFQLKDLKFDRSLCPPDAEGLPWLVIFSDGSNSAYGFAAYIRWQLKSGGYWCRLIMAKCRIAPLRKITTPQMELNAAVLSKRGRKVIEQEMRFKFSKILQVVDSETVLNMLNKTSTRFKVYEGVRIGEVQSATNGDMSCWAWVAGKDNTADWLTRGRFPSELNPDSEWWKGPSILYSDLGSWGLKFGMQKDISCPGEKKFVSSAAGMVEPVLGLSAILDYNRFSDVKTLLWVVARLLGIAKGKSFRSGCVAHISADLYRSAELLVISEVQKVMYDDLSDRNGRYKNLCPMLGDNGIWVVGSRLKDNNPMTSAMSDLQILLPAGHYVTYLLMRAAHVDGGHRGRDATLARFRERFWVTQGSKLAYSVRSSCQLCKLRDSKPLSQTMGGLPAERVKPAPPFSKVMVDLFGPITVRGEVQKRTSGKAYGVMFTDLVMRAVHIEGVFGYDTGSFLLALSRFVSVRGWPDTMFSDPGSQLIGADRELVVAWQKVERSVLLRKGTENGMNWKFGPADSPWYQGAVESLVKSAKRSIRFAIHNQRLSPSEFLTICYEVSNLLNERPIGTLPSKDACINVLTPNCLLLGRSTAKNPGGWQPQGTDLSVRQNLVQSLIDAFWSRWIEYCAPALVIRKKWHVSCRNLQVGDVVIVSDSNAHRGEYKLGVVKDVFPSGDGKVRRVRLSYKNYKTGDILCYSGTPDVTVTRSVQRLALLVPIDGKFDPQL